MYESQIKRFLILHKELDADDGELTRTNKVRRGAISERYGELIDALYNNAQTCHIKTQVVFEDGKKGDISANIKIKGNDYSSTSCLSFAYSKCYFYYSYMDRTSFIECFIV